MAAVERCDEMSDDRVYLFPNGTAFADWRCENCDHCMLAYNYDEEDWNCDLEKAIDMAYFAHGYVTRAIADRLGAGDGYKIFICLEKIDKGGDGSTEWPPFPNPWDGGFIEPGQMDLSIIWGLPELDEFTPQPDVPVSPDLPLPVG